MILTEQQTLVLFDIAKEAMKQKGGFAGYTNDTIMKLVNNIISQQDNTQLINFKDIIKNTTKVKPIAEGKEKSNIKSNTKPLPSQSDDNFWDD